MSIRKLVSFYEVHSYSSEGFSASVRIEVSGPSIDPDEHGAAFARVVQAERVYHDLWSEIVRSDPETRLASAEHVEGLKAAFGPVPYYALTPLPNGYCSRPCCYGRPWAKFHTTAGDVVMGWRKRVLVVDWTSSDFGKTAEDVYAAGVLLSSGGVSHGERYIHVNSTEEARKVVVFLFASR